MLDCLLEQTRRVAAPSPARLLKPSARIPLTISRMSFSGFPTEFLGISY